MRQFSLKRVDFGKIINDIAPPYFFFKISTVLKSQQSNTISGKMENMKTLHPINGDIFGVKILDYFWEFITIFLFFTAE